MRRTLIFVAVTALLLAGCGGDDGDSEETTGADAQPAVTKRQFIREADAVCRRFDERQRRLAERLPKNIQDAEDLDELVDFAEEVSELLQRGIRELEAIELPADSDARRGAQRYLDSVRDQRHPLDQFEDSTETLAELAEQRRPDEREARRALIDFQRSYEALVEAGNRSQGQAENYGLRECAEDDDERSDPTSTGPDA